jgi:hypothetical protein
MKHTTCTLTTVMTKTTESTEMKTETKKTLREIAEAVVCALVLISPMLLNAIADYIRK